MAVFPILVRLVLETAPLWTLRGEHDGYSLESRMPPGSAFEELRVTKDTRASAAELCDAIWAGPRGSLEPGVRKREVLSETATDRWTYEQIAAPLVADRDYTVHVHLEPHGDAGCRITFQTDNERGPPPRRGLVRVPVIRGSWEISGASAGRLVYTIYAEPGGSIPAFLCVGTQRENALHWVKVVLARMGSYARR